MPYKRNYTAFMKGLIPMTTALSVPKKRTHSDGKALSLPLRSASRIMLCNKPVYRRLSSEIPYPPPNPPASNTSAIKQFEQYVAFLKLQ